MISRIRLVEFDQTGKALAFGLGAVVTLTFLTGGGSQDHGPGDVAAQLLALPVIVLALWTLSGQLITGLGRAALLVTAWIALLPALQLLPLPASMWTSGAARMALHQDLLRAGVSGVAHTWSLTPHATERALWSLLPALATFLAALAIHPRYWRAMLLLLIALALASVMLGLIQLGLPQDSLLNPFPEWVPAFGGVFANPNHQSTLLVIALVLATGLMVEARADREEDSHVRPWMYGVVMGLCLLTLPLTDSRGGVILAMLALVAVLAVMGALPARRVFQSRRALAAVVAATAVAALGVFTAVQWIKVDAAEDIRLTLARATTVMGAGHAPWGSGVGSFVQVFEQDAPTPLRMSEYVNHAHNEFVQWWLEGGVVAVLLVIAAFGVLGWCVLKALRTRDSAPRAIALPALVAIAAVMVHSLADYPLRTPALMTVCALLAGLAVASAGAADRSGHAGAGGAGRTPVRPS